jgi:hypothetical protein
MRRKYLNDSTLFLHFCDYLPFEEDLDIHLNELEFPSCKKCLYQVRLKFILKDSFQYTCTNVQFFPLSCPPPFHYRSMLEILTYSSFWHAIWWDSFLCESDADFLFIRVSVHRVYMKFSSQFPQQLLIANAWKFSTLFLLACNMVGIIFVWIGCRLPVYPCVCPKIVYEILYMWNFLGSFLSNYSLQILEILTHSFFWHTIWWDSFFHESDFSVNLYVECITNFRRSFPSNHLAQVLEIQHTTWWDSFLYESDVNFLFVLLFVHI